MLGTIQSILDGLAAAAVNVKYAAGPGRAFELLLMTEIAAELKRRGYGIRLYRSDGTFQDPLIGPMNFIQRGGAPSGIRPASRGPNGPTSIAFRRAKRLPAWEIWNGVQFVGAAAAGMSLTLQLCPNASAMRCVAFPRAGGRLGMAGYRLNARM
jgi:hypothetical protein